MTFWIVAILMGLAVSALVAIALMRGRAGAEPAASYDLRVYRDQLAGVDRDLARGVIAQADAERVRTEISRRILAADAQMQKETADAGPSRRFTLAAIAGLAVAMTGGALALYQGLGAPGYGDLSLKSRIEMAEALRDARPGQAEAEARLAPPSEPELEDSYKALIDRLRETVAERPDDLQGQQLLARHEANAGNFRAAHAAQARVIALKGEAASAGDYGEYAELMILAAGGFVSPEAEAALRATLERDPHFGPARYYWGLMLAQVGRPDLSFAIWEQTLRRGPPDAPWLDPIRRNIEEMAWRAGVTYDLPAPAQPLSGPTAEDMQAASEMDAGDRAAMIRGMVDQLSQRLATEGGSAAEWARLIGALGVLGDTDRARAIYDEATGTFAGDAAALAEIESAGQQAGVAE